MLKGEKTVLTLWLLDDNLSRRNWGKIDLPRLV